MTAPAVVLGDIDLVRPLGLAGVRCALFALDGDRAQFSRHVDEVLPWVDHWGAPDAVVEALLAYAARCETPPVLYPQTDGDLLVVSRARDVLDGPCRFLLADAELVEDLVDKRRFATLAARVGLPVPRTVELTGTPGAPVPALDVRFPVVVKPLTRRADRWGTVESAAKAWHAANAGAFAALWPQVSAAGLDVLVQEAIPGPESRIESHHVHVDAGGTLVADFTGRKVRTWPLRYGISTSVELTDAADVRAAGREVVERIGLRGVAKLDFKRDDDGRLWLLEVNPRFTLWHHLAARAGLNVPAVVHADLTGAARPPVRPARPGAAWCDPVPDLRAARASGVSPASWARFAASCAAVSGFALGDPAPLLRATVVPAVRRRLPGA